MIRIFIRTLMTFVITATLFFFSFRAYDRSIDGFHLAHITYKGAMLPEWKSPPLTSSESVLLEKILQQPFDYIGKGAQSYVFGSREGNYVIKFFKFKHLRPNWVIEWLPSSLFKEYKLRSKVRKERLVDSVFVGHRLAYERHRRESGLVFLMLDSSMHPQKKVILYDKSGKKWELALDHIPYVIQERVETTRNVMRRALDLGDLLLAKERFSQIVALYRTEYAKGIYDRDHGVLHNIGFIGDRAIHLDVGKLTANLKMQQPEYWQPDLEIMSKRFLSWVHKEYPQHEKELSDHVRKELGSV